MDARVLIVGQGLAGTALGLELEAAGIDFAVASAGHADAASRVAAGLINPVTGRRWVKSEQVDALLPEAEAFYRRAERTLGAALWRPLRLRRLWRDAEERGRIGPKLARGELAPYAVEADETGVEVRGAARVELPVLLALAEGRWIAAGKLRRARVAAGELAVDARGVRWGGEVFTQAVLCTGAGALAREWFAEVPGVVAQGEIIDVAGAGLAAGEARNREGHWLIGVGDGQARAGATYVRGCETAEVSAEAREKLLAAARVMSGREDLRVTGQTAGLRLTLPDRLPLVARHAVLPGVGWCGALGSKGALWAPRLARVWREWLQEGRDFPAEITQGRW